jgi:FkbM family methyltransferase
MATLLRKPPFRVARLFYQGYRGLVRLVTVPVRFLPEGALKNGVRSWLLKFQHSLPTELVVNRGDTVVQVGTPNPKTLLRFRRAVGPRGRLVIVEAMPGNQERLQSVIDEQRLDNVTLVRAAACNENRRGELAVSPFWGDHKIPLDSVRMDNDLRPENADMELIPVDFVRLDDALAEVGVDALDYLSVTVNGAEAEVLKGAAGILDRSSRGTRVYAKGHALDEQDRPIHLQTQELMAQLGYRTRITRGEPSSTLEQSWLWRAGDLYAWKA